MHQGILYVIYQLIEQSVWGWIFFRFRWRIVFVNFGRLGFVVVFVYVGVEITVVVFFRLIPDIFADHPGNVSLCPFQHRPDVVEVVAGDHPDVLLQLCSGFDDHCCSSFFFLHP
jgi:hypothetical protein